MQSRTGERQTRLVTLVVVFCLLLAVNAVLLLVGRGSKGGRARQAATTLVGQDLDKRLRRAGIDLGRRRASVEVILFADEEVQLRLGSLGERLGELLRRGCAAGGQVLCGPVWPGAAGLWRGHHGQWPARVRWAGQGACGAEPAGEGRAS
ncbi:MAG: hypothetical protein QHJ34_09210 [bacterium]|nr:hypothetical protein [candidate division KSB1 bacterium]MDH7560394.1 hypothetical protein [bacterium]